MLGKTDLVFIMKAQTTQKEMIFPKLIPWIMFGRIPGAYCNILFG